jgi:hypothetical protein
MDLPISRVTAMASAGRASGFDSLAWVFPGEIISAHYLRDHLVSLEILIVEQARFNRAPPRDVLALAVEPGTKVFDERKLDGSSGKTRFHRPTHPVADIKQAVDLQQAANTHRAPPATTLSTQTPLIVPLLLMLMLALIAGAGWVAKRGVSQ